MDNFGHSYFYCLYGGISTTVLLSILQDGQTALFNTTNADVIKMLVEYGASVDIRDEVAIVL